MTSPYARIGAKLVDQGYAAIPILPGTKRPGSVTRGEWYGDMDWQRYCDRLPTDIETRIWSGWKDAGVCVALGASSGGLVAIDIDSDSAPMQRAIESVLEPSPVQKAGRKGYTAFYRANPCVVSRAFNVNSDRALDLLAHGKQTLLPPTIHPDSGKPYIWLTQDTLEHLTTDRLPMLPDDIADRLGAVLEQFGYYAPVERPANDNAGDSLWREVNDRALEKFDLWVPALGIGAKRRHNGTWRGVAIWKGAEDANVSFAREGIKDFGADLGYTAIDVVMAAHSSDFATAEKWLREKLGFREPPPVRLLLRPKPAPAAAVVEPPLSAPIYAPPGKVNPFEPKNAGGLLAQIAEWIFDTSIRPSRELAMLSALGFMTAFAGRRYVGPTGLGCNLYLCGVASTASGKRAPLAAVKTLIFESKLDWLYGSGDPASDSAIERVVRRSPSSLFPIDEIGVTLQGFSGKNAPPHMRAVRRTMLELYSESASGGIWTGKDRAGTELDSSATPVFSPTLSILGMSTQTEFYKGLTEENLRDGLVGRLTVIEMKTRAPMRDDAPSLVTIPAALAAAIKDAYAAWPKPAGNMVDSNARSATAKPYLHAVPWESDAVRAEWKKHITWQESAIDDNEAEAGIIGRAAEQTLRIATLRAVSRDFLDPQITAADIDFGWAFVERSFDTIKDGIRRYMAGSEFETLWKCMLEHVQRAGDKGMSKSAIMRAGGVSKAKPQDFKAAIEYLSSTGLWKWREGKRGPRFFPATEEELAEDAREDAA